MHDPLVALQLIYQVFSKVLGSIVLRTRSHTTKDVEILILRHQLTVLRRSTPRPRMTWTDRAVIAVLTRLLPARRLGLPVTLATVLRWHRLWGSRSRSEPVTCGDRQPRMIADVSLRLLTLLPAHRRPRTSRILKRRRIPPAPHFARHAPSSRPGPHLPADQAPTSSRRASQRVRACRLTPQVSAHGRILEPHRCLGV
jgi:hypothetical protein